MSISVLAFAAGCAAGATAFVLGHEICFALPRVLVPTAKTVDALREQT